MTLVMTLDEIVSAILFLYVFAEDLGGVLVDGLRDRHLRAAR